VTGLAKALATARKASAEAGVANEHSYPEAVELCYFALRELLAALDAQKPALFGLDEQLADPRFVGMNAVRDDHLDHMRGLYTVPLYLVATTKHKGDTP